MSFKRFTPILHTKPVNTANRSEKVVKENLLGDGDLEAWIDEQLPDFLKTNEIMVLPRKKKRRRWTDPWS